MRFRYFGHWVKQTHTHTRISTSTLSPQSRNAHSNSHKIHNCCCQFEAHKIISSNVHILASNDCDVSREVDANVKRVYESYKREWANKHLGIEWCVRQNETPNKQCKKEKIQASNKSSLYYKYTEIPKNEIFISVNEVAMWCALQIRFWSNEPTNIYSVFLFYRFIYMCSVLDALMYTRSRCNARLIFHLLTREL